ncbi:PqqD family protein [Rhodohalobacter sp. SW132]|uniref:HPr-rel-A system PqqD family peptide chaperone n=1 Tax=Rhodohalobacter sp. SW132 TaxID=2293433 RepID=UPI000E227838|nr:HPr-rel-A system PqqD family peptide chaperone [Rhodohalobacter sp. SW132]REL33809.1 PqqD family protein [Rhodohalobacter sp. SW132]
MITPNSKIKRSSRPLSSQVADELVMFDTESGKYYGLNNIATEVWNKIEEPVTVEELCRALTDEFDVTPQQCREDMLEFLPQLVEKGLIEVEKV